MRKHFLLLFLLTLLPLAGWAAIGISTEATLNDGVNYDGSKKQVIKTPVVATAEGTLTYFYAVTTTAATPAADAADTWYEGIDNAALKVDGANTYYAHYKIVSSNGGEGTATGTITGTFAIAKVAATVATAPTAKNLTYSAADQALVNAGTSLTGTLKYNLIGGDDPDAYDVDIPEATNAGSYTVYYMVKGDANHNDLIAPATQKVTVNIAKKNLKAKAVAFTAAQSIFGVFEQNTAVAIEYDGFVGNDWYNTEGGKTNVFTGTYAAPTAAINATVNAKTVKIGTKYYIKADSYPEALEVTGGSAANYEIICLNNDLNISKAKIKVDLKSKPDDAVFGSKAAEKTEWPIAWADANTYLTIKRQTGTDLSLDGSWTAVAEADFAAVVLRKGEGTEKSPYAFNSEVKMTRANTSTNKGQYLLALSGVEATANTEILEQTNSGNLKFEITAAVLTIKASNKWKVYGTADPKEADDSWAYTVKAGDEDYDGLSDAQVAAIKAGLTRAEGETAGDYKISFSAALKANDLFKDNYTITWTDGWLTIEKADLTITAKPQTLYKGNKVENLVQTEYTIDGIVTNEDLSIADAAEVSLAFGTVNTAGIETLVPVSAAAGHVGELTTAGDYDYGIKVVLANAAALAENYNITLVNGALTVISLDDQIVLNFAADNTEALATANGKKISAKMGNKTMVKDNWHAMVLPFATTPLEISKVLDQYVIINRLSENSTADHIAFELEMSEIPAGEAFLIKSAEDIVWDGKIFPAVAGDPGRPIVKDVSAEAKGGNKFVGVYKATSVKSTDAQMIAWLGNTSQKKADGTTPRENKWYEPYSAAKEIAPFEAYLMYAPGVSSAPLITVEEIDGTVTAISEVKAGEFQEVKADGWYTINGVKLMEAPTQKGIYINNGKKVFIK